LHLVCIGKEDLVGTATLVEGLLLIGLAAAGTWEGVRLTQEELVTPEPLGPGWYLFAISVALMVCALAYLVSSRGRATAAKKPDDSSRFGPVARTSVLLVLYPAVIPLISYPIGSLVFFVLTLRVFGVSSWVKCTLIGIAFALSFQFVFADLGGLLLPQPQWASELRILR